MGWPRLEPGRTRDGRPTPHAYAGPLPQHCRHRGHRPLVRRPQDTDFGTRGTGAYHADMCRWLATAFLQDFWQRAEASPALKGGATGAPTPPEGGDTSRPPEGGDASRAPPAGPEGGSAA